MATSGADEKSNAGKSVDDILTWGANAGIQYFIEFYPLYQQMYSGSYKTVQDLEARYDEQRGMNLVKLSATRDALNAALAEAKTQLETQQNCGVRLQQAWSGGAASQTAHNMVADQIKLAGNDIEAAQHAADTISSMIDSTRQAVVDKAALVYHIPDFGGSNPKFEINGRSPADVQMLIDICKAREWVSGTQVDSVNSWFPDRNILKTHDSGGTTYTDASDAENSLSKDMGRNTQVAAQYWMDAIFKPELEGKLKVFDDACNQADNSINQYYKNVTDALNAVHDTRYPRPGTDSQPSQSASVSISASSTASGNSLSGSTTASGTGVGSGTDSSGSGTGTSGSGLGTSWTGTSGTSTITSAFNALASGITGLGTLVQTAESAFTQMSGLGSTFASLSQSVTQGLGSLTTQIQQGIDGMLGTHNANSNISDATVKTVAEFDVAGKQMKLEQGKNGAMELVLADSDGKGKSYTLELNEHGIPVITSQDESGTGNSTSGASPESSAHSSSDNKSDRESTTSQKSTDQSAGSHKSTDQSTGNQGTTSNSGSGNSSSAVNIQPCRWSGVLRHDWLPAGCAG